MKVTGSNNAELNTNKKLNTQPVGNEFDSAAIADAIPGASEKSDFAGVLERVTRSHQESENRQSDRQSEGHKETSGAKPREKDKLESDVYMPGTGLPLTRETVASTEVSTDSRPILHSTDIDSMVNACRVQIAANGRQEVTLELSHSMLEGLRVKVSSDAAGRISADFLAANEAIKSLLDSRSSELIEQLRSRGIDLAEFKSSVAADTGGRNDARHEQPPATSQRIAGEIESVTSLSESESTSTTEDGLAAGATYRA